MEKCLMYVARTECKPQNNNGRVKKIDDGEVLTDCREVVKLSNI